ncbi:MAG: DUF3772 domain-containing protein, partial [Xanthobacteraceae bacterium]
LRLALDHLAASVGRASVTAADLAGMRASLEPPRAALRTQPEPLEQRFNDIEVRLKQIGAPPAPGAPAEDATIATERTRLTEQRAEADSALKQARLLTLRADDLATRIIDRRRALFTQELLQRSASILDPGFWRQAASALPDELRGILLLSRSWWSYAWDNGGTGGFAAAFLMLALFGVAAVMLTRWWRRRALLQAFGGTRFAKSSASLIVLLRLAITMPAVIAGIVLIVQAFGLVPSRIMELALGIFVSVAIASFGRAVGIALFAPQEPQRRLIAIRDETARILSWHLTAAARVLGIVIFVNLVQKTVVAPVTSTIAVSALMAAAIAALVIHLLLRMNWDDEKGAPGSSAEHRGQWLRGGGWLQAMAIIVALLAGYIGLAAFLAGRFLIALGIIGALYIALEFVDSLFTEILTVHSARGRAIASMFGLSATSVQLVGTLMSAIIRLLLVLVAFFPLLGPGGIFAADIFGVARGAAFGLRIGDVTISFAAVLTALVVVLGGILLTRAAQKWLQRRLLPHTTLEPGLQHSVSTIFGYIGIVATASLAMGSLGIDLQKITLVAGALSIGIGFGLQSIVSNFVSGLIVLAERPVRVGDLIEVKGERGTVRRIRVRATELETGDNASLIIPNSELITGIVKNWTHANTLGRISVTVGVGYDSDPEQVRDILLETARQHQAVLKNPQPSALLTGFGDNALQFELGCTTINVVDAGRIRSDLRIAILKSFREAGISIPFPQREVRVAGSGKSEAILS